MTYNIHELDALFASPNPQPYQNSTAAIAQMVERDFAMRLKNVGVDPDAEIISRVKHTMQPSECLLEWYSRVGMGRAQILQSTPEQISRFAAQAAANAATEPSIDGFKPRAIPTHFMLD